MLLQAAKSGHPYEIIIQEWLNRRYQWAVSTSILAEYRELITLRSGARRWHELEQVFDLADRLGGLLIHGTPHYQFHVGVGELLPASFGQVVLDGGLTEDESGATQSQRRAAPTPRDEFFARIGTEGEGFRYFGRSVMVQTDGDTASSESLGLDELAASPGRAARQHGRLPALGDVIGAFAPATTKVRGKVAGRMASR